MTENPPLNQLKSLLRRQYKIFRPSTSTGIFKMNDNFQKNFDICVCLKDLINVMRFLNKLCSVEHTKCSTILQGARESARPADFLLFSQAVFLFFATRLTVNMPHGNCLFCAFFVVKTALPEVSLLVLFKNSVTLGSKIPQ